MSYYYFDSDKCVLFTTTFRNCADGSTREEIAETIDCYKSGWKFIDVLNVFNPIYRSVFSGSRLV